MPQCVVVDLRTMINMAVITYYAALCGRVSPEVIQAHQHTATRIHVDYLDFTSRVAKMASAQEVFFL